MNTHDNVLLKIKKQLQESGYKLTSQREATIKVILEKEKEHLSAEEIYMLIKKKNPEIGLATVYRTLEILKNLEIVNTITFTDGLSRYDLKREGYKHFHHHLLCLECGTIEEVYEDLLEEIEKTVEQRFGFLVKDHRLTFHGLCKTCQERIKKDEPSHEV